MYRMGLVRGSKNGHMDGPSDWVNNLPAELAAHRRLLEGLLAWCQEDKDTRWLTVGCSLERGNAEIICQTLMWQSA